MRLSDIIVITITTETGGILQAGFGVPLILAPHANNVDRIRYYTDLAGMVTDGFTSTTAPYKAASAMFAQNPRPERIAVGRLALYPTQRFAVTPTAVHSAKYSLK